MTYQPGNKVPSILRMLALASVVLLLTTCGTQTSSPADNEKCGDIITWTTIVNGNFITSEYDNANQIQYLYYEDLLEPDDICTDEHVSAEFEVTTDTNLPLPGITFQGKIYWGGFYEKQGKLEWGADDEYSITLGGVGLKEAFGDAPGWVGLQIIAKVESTGDVAADKARVFDEVGSMKITFTYHKTK